MWADSARLCWSGWGGKLGAGTLAEDKAVSQMTLDQPHGENAGLTLKSRFNADWQTISSGLRRDLGAQIYGQWIRSITLGDFCDLTGTLELLLPSDFSASWVSDHYADRLRLAWSSTNSSVKQLKLWLGQLASLLVLAREKLARLPIASPTASLRVTTRPIVYLPLPIQIVRRVNFVRDLGNWVLALSP